MPRNSPIRRKLMRLVLITSGVVLLLTCASFFAYEYFSFRETSRSQLSTLGAIVAANSTAALAFKSPQDANEILQALKAEKNILAAIIYDEDGEIFAKYPSTITADKFPPAIRNDGYSYLDNYLEGFQPIIQGEKRVGTLFLRSDMNLMYQTFARYSIIILLITAVSALVAFLLSRRLQKRISDPIILLAKTAGIVSDKKDYTVRAKKFDNDELGTLTEAFNHMLVQIEKQNAEITSFNQELEEKVVERTQQLEQANNELKLKNELVETIIASSVSVIAVFDRNFNYLVLNDYGKQIYNVGDDIIGKNILEIFPQIKNSPMYQQLGEALKGKETKSHYYKSWISNKVLENFYIPLFDKENNVYAVLVMGHDITEIVNANEQLKMLNEELEKSNFDLEQFAFVASHDLQEPLRKIQTFSHLIEKHLDDKELTRKHLSKVISSAGRMTDLIKAVLNYSRISNEKGEFYLVNLNEIIDNIKSDFELTILEKDANILHTNLPLIYGNKFQMHQLFHNLISNALKFSTEKPEIIISGTVFERNAVDNEPSLFAAEEFVELTIRDNGIGFEQKYADKIFNVFQRLHTKKEYPGTGIGLALCKKIVDNHHGSISVESKPGEGTTFKITLPMKVPANAKVLQ
jgi:PAS domain S-box-containing protein